MENKDPLHWEVESPKEEVKKTRIKKTDWKRALLIFIISMAFLSFIRKQYIGAAINLTIGTTFFFLSNKMTQSQDLKSAARAKKIYLIIGYALTIGIIIFSVSAITYHFFNK
ncbi:MAG: hypothetical protein ABH831_00830 [Candidatus Nealsonbacteria bacterium]